MITALLLSLASQDVTWEKNWNDALKKAKEQNKMALLYFHSDKVKDCKRFATETLPQPSVANALREYVCCQLDPEGTDDDNRLWQKLGQAIPGVFIYAPDGTLFATVGSLGAKYVQSILVNAPTVYFQTVLPAKDKLAKNPEDTDTLISLGTAYAMIDNKKASTENFKKALDLLVKKGDTKGAIDVIRKQLDIAMDTKWYLEARPAARKLLELDPRDESKLGAKAAWVDGMAACFERKWQEAVDIMKPACDKYKDSDLLDKMMFTLGSAYMYNKQNDKALEVFDTIVQKYPGTETAQLAEIQARKLRK